ncbi:hypothetical protein Nepgr_003933 [Nepenthes gracilis]|uniref:Uncharacterized protein n=1 Tax=Nepenthes gracilis TaxID=150966 RepID=A0AAD3S0J8_NEPGR|nr:hypothetical protein Nepgr_003933 [Nepenthes gracilis]
MQFPLFVLVEVEFLSVKAKADYGLDILALDDSIWAVEDMAPLCDFSFRYFYLAPLDDVLASIDILPKPDAEIVNHDLMVPPSDGKISMMKPMSAIDPDHTPSSITRLSSKYSLDVSNIGEPITTSSNGGHDRDQQKSRSRKKSSKSKVLIWTTLQIADLDLRVNCRFQFESQVPIRNCGSEAGWALRLDGCCQEIGHTKSIYRSKTVNRPSSQISAPLVLTPKVLSVPPSPGGILSPGLGSRMAIYLLNLPGSVQIQSSVESEIPRHNVDFSKLPNSHETITESLGSLSSTDFVSSATAWRRQSYRCSEGIAVEKPCSDPLVGIDVSFEHHEVDAAGPVSSSLADKVVPSALGAGSDGVLQEVVVVSQMRSVLAVTSAGGVSEAVLQSSPDDGVPTGSFMEGSSVAICSDAITSVDIPTDHPVLVVADPCVDEHVAGSFPRPLAILEDATIEDGSRGCISLLCLLNWLPNRILVTSDFGHGNDHALSNVDPNAGDVGSDSLSHAIPTLIDDKVVQRCLDLQLPCCSQADCIPEGSSSGNVAARQGLAQCDPTASPKCHQGHPTLGDDVSTPVSIARLYRKYSLVDSGHIVSNKGCMSDVGSQLGEAQVASQDVLNLNPLASYLVVEALAKVADPMHSHECYPVIAQSQGDSDAVEVGSDPLSCAIQKLTEEKAFRHSLNALATDHRNLVEPVVVQISLLMQM